MNDDKMSSIDAIFRPEFPDFVLLYKPKTRIGLKRGLLNHFDKPYLVNRRIEEDKPHLGENCPDTFEEILARAGDEPLNVMRTNPNTQVT